MKCNVVKNTILLGFGLTTQSKQTHTSGVNRRIILPFMLKHLLVVMIMIMMIVVMMILGIVVMMMLAMLTTQTESKQGRTHILKRCEPSRHFAFPPLLAIHSFLHKHLMVAMRMIMMMVVMMMIAMVTTQTKSKQRHTHSQAV